MNRDEKKLMIKENIVENMFALLSEKPWGMISSDDICRSAGISKRTLYSYYASQDEMYLELVRRSFLRLRENMDSEIEKESCIKDKILSLGKAYLNFMVEYPVMGMLVIDFNESRFIENYHERVIEIGRIANHYELFSFFRRESVIEAGFTRQLAIMLWSHIQGMAQLINSKRQWMEGYYGSSVHELVTEQMDIMEKILERVENEK